MKISVAIAKLGFLLVLTLAANIAHACTIWLDKERAWHSDDCTLGELVERLGPELEQISVRDARGLCDALITQRDLNAFRP